MQVDTKTPAKSNDTNQNSLFRSLKTFRRKLDKFANNYTPSDGLDELAVALISFLPKVVQPAVTVGALTVLSPFVWKGAKAMAADHQETLNNINSLGKEKASLKNEIINLFSTDNDNKNEIERILNKDNNETDLKEFLIKNKDNDNLIDLIAKLQHKTKDLAIENYPTSMRVGVAAMTGMTAGVAVGALKAAAETAEQFGIKPEFMKATKQGLDLLTTGIFIPSQAAMAFYAVNKVRQGLQKNKHLEEQKQALEVLKQESNKRNKKDIIESAEKHLNSLKKTNLFGDVIYGAGTALAETGMIVGGLMGASSVLIPSALLTLGFAGMRMLAQNHESNLTGDVHDHDHNGKPLQMLRNPEPDSDTTANTQHNNCPSMGCNDSHDEFDNDTKRVSNNFLENNKLISNVHSQLDHLKSNNFNKYSVTNAKDTFDDLFSRHERIKPLDLNKPGAGWASNKSESSIEKYSPVELYIKSILDNENATELAITFLRKELGKDKQKNQDALNTFKNYEDKIYDLEKARKNEAQNTEVLSNNVKILTKKLENIFTNNLKTLDEPQYAKKILPHLLKDRLNKIKRDRVFLMNNLVHIAQKEKLKQSLEGTPA